MQAVGFAVAFVDHMEVVDVDDDRVQILVLVMLVVLLRVAVEILFIIQTRQRVALRGVDDVPVLRELNGAVHAGEHHPGQRIGLGDEVHGPAWGC